MMNSTIPCRLALTLALAWAGVFARHAVADAATQPATVTINCDDSKIAWAPYVWKEIGGSGPATRAEAGMPGAYLKLNFQGSASIQMLIDGSGNKGCPGGAMPVVDFSIDDGPFKTVQLTKTDDLYPLPLADHLDAAKTHRLDFHFRSASLSPGRWAGSMVHLRLAGVQLDAGGSLLPVTLRSKKAIGFGDSITEGVIVEGLVPYYSNLLMNNARVTWFPLVAGALDCEYGQLGTGGQGMVKLGMEMPPLPKTWDHYDPATSRLTNGLLLPEPDYVFCAMGTNDFLQDSAHPSNITEAYTNWLAAVRKACPNSAIFCIVPPLGWHAAEVAATVEARNKDGDAKVYLIDTARYKAGYAGGIPTQFAPDGVHPSVYGNAMLGALISAEVEKIIGVSRVRARVD